MLLACFCDKIKTKQYLLRPLPFKVITLNVCYVLRNTIMPRESIKMLNLIKVTPLSLLA